MHGRHPKPKSLSTLIAALVLMALGAAPAAASPEGDPDPAFGTEGTQFRALQDFGQAKPLVSPVPGGGAVSAVGQRGQGDVIVVHGYSDAGAPAFFTGGALSVPVQTVDFEPGNLNTLLDNRVLANGDIVLTMSVFNNNFRSNRAEAVPVGGLVVIVLAANGTEKFRHAYANECDEGTGEAVAARADADGNVAALWDCSDEVRVSRYLSDGPVADDDADVEGVDNEGTDLELGPGGDIYVLGIDREVVSNGDVNTRVTTGEQPPVDSVVVERLDVDLDPVPGYGSLLGGAAFVANRDDELPEDLAVDSTGRAIVWTTPDDSGSHGTWTFHRLLGNGDPDGSWGSGGRSDIVNGSLALPFADFDAFMTTTPSGKVVAFGPGATGDNYDEGKRVVIRLTDGALDPSWGAGGLTILQLPAGPFRFNYAGDPRLQSDGKVLVPYTVEDQNDRSLIARVLPDPGASESNVGVTRLTPDASVNPTSTTAAPVVLRPSAVPAICGRRAISLVRADVRGKRIKLSGLVGKRLFGKTVTIQTNYGAKASAFTKAGTVKASSTGTFTAFVPKPSARKFKGARFRAVSGSARSPQLKLPQSLTSRSVKSAAGTITVKGRVKRSVLGKRNRVTIRRLVCGRYRTVGKAKPASDGSYTIKFNATAIRGVAFYRAEAIVQVRPGAKKYAIQYARALAIKVNDQTG